MRRRPTTPKMELNSYLGRAGVLNYLNLRLRDRNDERTLFTTGASRKCLRLIRANVTLGDTVYFSADGQFLATPTLCFRQRGFAAGALAGNLSIGFDAQVPFKGENILWFFPRQTSRAIRT